MGIFILVLHLEGLEPRVLRYNPLACALFLFGMQYKLQIHYNLCNVVSTSCAPDQLSLTPGLLHPNAPFVLLPAIPGWQTSLCVRHYTMRIP